eukprot:9501030-Pyramimonas_sp.AAC.1
MEAPFRHKSARQRVRELPSPVSELPSPVGGELPSAVGELPYPVGELQYPRTLHEGSLQTQERLIGSLQTQKRLIGLAPFRHKSARQRATRGPPQAASW